MRRSPGTRKRGAATTMCRPQPITSEAHSACQRQPLIRQSHDANGGRDAGGRDGWGCLLHNAAVPLRRLACQLTFAQQGSCRKPGRGRIVGVAMDQDLADRPVYQDHKGASDGLGIGMALFGHHVQ